MKRFEVVEAAYDPALQRAAYTIRDNDAEKYHLDGFAVTLRLSMRGATEIASVLNREWEDFVRSPW